MRSLVFLVLVGLAATQQAYRTRTLPVPVSFEAGPAQPRPALVPASFGGGPALVPVSSETGSAQPGPAPFPVFSETGPAQSRPILVLSSLGGGPAAPVPGSSETGPAQPRTTPAPAVGISSVPLQTVPVPPQSAPTLNFHVSPIPPLSSPVPTSFQSPPTNPSRPVSSLTAGFFPSPTRSSFPLPLSSILGLPPFLSGSPGLPFLPQLLPGLLPPPFFPAPFPRGFLPFSPRQPLDMVDLQPLNVKDDSQPIIILDPLQPLNAKDSREPIDILDPRRPSIPSRPSVSAHLSSDPLLRPQSLPPQTFSQESSPSRPQLALLTPPDLPLPMNGPSETVMILDPATSDPTPVPLAPNPTIRGPIRSNCNRGVSRFDDTTEGKGYHFSWCDDDGGRQVTWQGARDYCATLPHAPLPVSIENQRENLQITSSIEQFQVSAVWTSGNKLYSQDWSWLNGAPFLFSSWSPTGSLGLPQPDGSGDELCLQVLNNFFGDGVTWHDVPCNHLAHVVCEGPVPRQDHTYDAL